MSELFHKHANHTAPGVPAKNSIATEIKNIPWQPCGTEGFTIKPLLEDPNRGLRTWLMQVDAGAFSPLHAHNEIEQIYLIEGSFYDQDRTYGPGDFIVRAAGAMHTAGSETGALILLFYSQT